MSEFKYFLSINLIFEVVYVKKPNNIVLYYYLLYYTVNDINYNIVT